MSGERMAAHMLIAGRVQGVGYRAWMAQTAQERGLAGWVRNRRDGSVEAVLIGPVAVVDEVIAAARRGPPAARVNRIATRPASAEDMAAVQPADRFVVGATV